MKNLQFCDTYLVTLWIIEWKHLKYEVQLIFQLENYNKISSFQISFAKVKEEKRLV